MNKSIVVIGKGKSVLKCNKEFLSKFDEIAICNFPPIEGYEKYIGDKADYHFLNAHDTNPYSRKILDGLGLKSVFNTHPKPYPASDFFLPSHKVHYDSDYGKLVTSYFKKTYDLDPSTGLQAFYYFVTNENYKTIGLVGFDFFKVGEKGYYYKVSEVQDSLKYLYSDDGTKPFNSKGVRIHENLHNSKKSEKLVKLLSDKYNKILMEPK